MSWNSAWLNAWPNWGELIGNWPRRRGSACPDLSYQWLWLGTQGGDVSLAIMEANNLPGQTGAVSADVVPDSSVEKANIQDTASVEEVEGVEVPVGGDIVIEADGQSVTDFATWLVRDKNSGDTVDLTILSGSKFTSSGGVGACSASKIGSTDPAR